MIADEGYQVLFLVSFWEFDSFLYQYFQRTAVVAVTDFGTGVGDTLRLSVQIVLADNLVRIIYIQLEVGHDGKVVPQLMFEVGHIAQMGKHVSHDVDDCICAALAFCAVFDCQRVVYHILDAAAIFGQRHPLLLGVILHL